MIDESNDDSKPTQAIVESGSTGSVDTRDRTIADLAMDVTKRVLDVTLKQGIEVQLPILHSSLKVACAVGEDIDAPGEPMGYELRCVPSLSQEPDWWKCNQIVCSEMRDDIDEVSPGRRQFRCVVTEEKIVDGKVINQRSWDRGHNDPANPLSQYGSPDEIPWEKSIDIRFTQDPSIERAGTPNFWPSPVPEDKQRAMLNQVDRAKFDPDLTEKTAEKLQKDFLPESDGADLQTSHIEGPSSVKKLN